MRKFPLPRLIFRLLIIALIIVMGVFLLLAYLQFTEPEDAALPQHIGTLNVNANWNAILKDNTFFPNKELGKEYAYISELVDHLNFNLDFDYEDGSNEATVSIDYQVDGTLRADYGAANTAALLLQLQYPQIAKGSITKAGPAFSDGSSFELSLTTYNYLINSFENTYHVSVTAQLNLQINVTLSIDDQRYRRTKDLQLSLNIPLGNTVFQISGTPSNKLEVFLPPSGGGQSGATFGTALNFLLVAIGMAVLALLCYLFLAPNQPDKRSVMLRQTLQKIKSRMATLASDPRLSAENLLEVKDIAGMIVLADETSQPILYYKQEPEHHFFVQHQGVLYVYSLQSGSEEAPKEDVEGKVQDAH